MTISSKDHRLIGNITAIEHRIGHAMGRAIATDHLVIPAHRRRTEPPVIQWPRRSEVSGGACWSASRCGVRRRRIPSLRKSDMYIMELRAFSRSASIQKGAGTFSEMLCS